MLESIPSHSALDQHGPAVKLPAHHKLLKTDNADLLSESNSRSRMDQLSDSKRRSLLDYLTMLPQQKQSTPGVHFENRDAEQS